MTLLTPVFNLVRDNIAFFWLAFVEQLNREYNRAPKQINSQDDTYIPPITEYEAVKDSILELYDELEPELVLDSWIKDGTLDYSTLDDGVDIDELIAHLHKSFLEPNGRYTAITRIITNPVFASWAAIFAAVTIAVTVYLKARKYEINNSNEFWERLSAVEDPICSKLEGKSEVEPEGKLDNWEVGEQVDTGDEENGLIDRSALDHSSPLTGSDTPTPKVPWESSSETSPLNLSSLSDEIESALYDDNLNLIDKIATDFGPFTLDSANELEVAAVTRAKDHGGSKSDTVTGKLQVILGITKSPKSRDRYAEEVVAKKDNTEEFPVIEVPIAEAPVMQSSLKSVDSIAAVEKSVEPQVEEHPPEAAATSEGWSSGFTQIKHHGRTEQSPLSVSIVCLESSESPPTLPISDLAGLTHFVEYEASWNQESRALKDAIFHDNFAMAPAKVVPPSPTNIPFLSPTRYARRSLVKGSPVTKPKQRPQISEAVMKYFLENSTFLGEEYLFHLFGEDPEVKINFNGLSSMTKQDIDEIVSCFEGKETSQNWSERYTNFDVLIGHTRLHLPDDHYIYFQDQIGQRLNDIFATIRTTRSKLLSKVILFARDLVFFGSETALSSETYISLTHSLLSLTRESQSSKYIQKLTIKSLCVMSQALTPHSFISYFEAIFDSILRNKKMKGEKYACLFMIKFALLMNRDKFTQDDLIQVVQKLAVLIPQLSIDPYQKTRSEIVELYLVLGKIGLDKELWSYYDGLTTFLKSQVPIPPAL